MESKDQTYKEFIYKNRPITLADDEESKSIDEYTCSVFLKSRQILIRGGTNTKENIGKLIITHPKTGKTLGRISIGLFIILELLTLLCSIKLWIIMIWICKFKLKGITSLKNSSIVRSVGYYNIGDQTYILVSGDSKYLEIFKIKHILNIEEAGID